MTDVYLGMADMKIKKWFKPSKSMGWSKFDSQTSRRRAALKAHKGNHLSAARAMMQISNINQDADTKRKARADAKHFFAMYKKYGK